MESAEQMLEKSVLLSTGDRVPLRFAAASLVLLNGLLLGDAADRGVVVGLRQACLGERPVSAAERERLAGTGLIGADGVVDPQFRKVVLAAVTGHGDAVSLHPPYTHPLDRALSDLVAAHATLQEVLSPDALADLLAVLNGAVGRWSAQARRPSGGSLPPPSPN